LDVTAPLGTSAQFTGIDPLGNPVTVVNALVNFGWEYVWHCHLLGHEENDMMRPIEFVVSSVIPAAPSLLSASASTPAPAVNLTWTDPTPPAAAVLPINQPINEVGFLIQRATNNGFTQGLTTFNVPANVTSFTDTTVQSNTRYYYRLQAFNAAGNSPFSNTMNLITAAGTVPAAPTGLAAAVMSATQVRLTWTDNATNETGFVIERSLNGAAFATLTTLGAHGGTGTMTYNDNTVTVGNTYVYRVKAVNGAVSSLYSNTATVTTNIQAPTNLTATILTATSIRLNWTDNANNEVNYKVERSADGGATYATLTAILAANTITYTDSAVPAPATYVYRVMAINGLTSSIPATVTVGVSVPAAPSGLAGVGIALNGNNRAVVLNWVDNSNNESSFTIQRCTGTTLTTCGPTAAGWANVTTTVPANATTYQDNGVVRRTTYSYRMRAVNVLVNPAGPFSWSNVATVPTP
jgi:hypothetical protein